MHARRIRRLERAADRIAGGAFDEPVVDTGNDELGELAAAFERMRVRLEKLDRARREFIANASHELRTPLFSLAGFLELLADEELDEDDAAGVPRDDARAGRPAGKARDRPPRPLPARRRPHARRARSRSTWARSRSSLVEEFGAVAERQDHVLEVVVDGEPIARADELRVLQVCRALVDNALVHTPAGTNVTLRACARPRARVPRGRRRRAGRPGGARAPRLRPFLPRRGRRRLGQRARAGDRAGAGRAAWMARSCSSPQPGRTVVRVVLGAAPTSVASPLVGERVST